MIVRPPWSKALGLRHYRRRLSDRIWLGRQADADRAAIRALSGISPYQRGRLGDRNAQVTRWRRWERT